MHERFMNGLVGATIFLLSMTLLVLFMRQSPSLTISNLPDNDVSILVKEYDVDYPVFQDRTLDRIVTNYVKVEIDTFERSLKDRTDPRNHIAMTYDVLYGDTHTTSIAFNQEKRVVGEPIVRERTFLTLDLKRKKAVSFADIFKQGIDYQSDTARLLHDFLKQEMADLSPAELVGILDLNLVAWKDFAITDTHLILYLDPHNLVGKNQPVSVAVQKNLVANLLTPEYASREGGHKIPETTYTVTTKPTGNTINPSQKMLTLTFDDGPSGLTPQLLQTLYKYEAHATFFVLGQKVQSTIPTLQRTIRDGNEIGNHTWNHPDLRALSSDQLAHQVNDTQNAIMQATGVRPTLLRPPYGFTNGAVAAFLQQQGLRQAMWTIDTNDWRDRNEQVIYDRIISGARDGAVILLHDIHPTSVRAAQRAIPALKAQGYQLVTLSQLYSYR